MGISQGTVSNYIYGVHDVSWAANLRLASNLNFDEAKRSEMAQKFTFGQQPSDKKPRLPGGAKTEEHLDAVLDHEEESRQRRDAKKSNGEGNGPGADGGPSKD